MISFSGCTFSEFCAAVWERHAVDVSSGERGVGRMSCNAGQRDI